MGLNWHRPLMRNGYLRGRVATDLHSVANTIANTIDNVVDAEMVGIDAEYAALCGALITV